MTTGIAALLWALPSLSGAGTGAQSHPGSTAAKAKAERAYGKLPLRFEANRGQTDSQVKFIARGAGYTLFLTPQESVLSLRKPAVHPTGGKPAAHGGRSVSGPASSATLRMRLAGANPHPQIDGLKRLPGQTNYLTGRDPHAWHTGVPGYASALSRGVYPGIDLLYHGKQGRLEYDFQVAPGANPNRIELNFSGARSVSLDRQGDLVLDTSAGVVRQHKPVIYQEVAGRRHAVSGSFVLHAGHRVGFRVGAYERSKPLVIDPTLAYSTYLGGAGIGDQGNEVAVDSAGSAYVTGIASSADFPTRDAFQGGFGGTRDVFVAKLTPDGTALAYSTFLGGSGDDQGNGIAVDGTGAAYVAGSTTSTNFPVNNALQPLCADASCTVGDAFVTKLKPDGSGLVYSTFLGGDQSDGAYAIGVDSAGAAYVAGQTGSSGTGTSTASFPLKNAAQSTFGGGPGDAFVTKLNPNNGTSTVTLAYSTFLGGTGTTGGLNFERGAGIAVDPSGAAYVSGQTASTDFPTTAGAYKTTFGGLVDAFVTKYTPTGTVNYSTFLGGSDFDQGYGIAVGHSSSDAGTAYVVGSTSSSDYPTTSGAYRTTSAGSADAFVTKLNAAGSDLVYSTYLGGSRVESPAFGASGIAVNSAGNAFVSGRTQSSNFPIARPVAEAGASLYVTEFTPAGSDLVFSTRLGGGGGSGEASGMALDSAGNAYVTGSTSASDLATQNPIQAKLAGGGTGRDAFVAKLSPASDANLAAPYVMGVSPKGGDLSSGRQVTITGTGLGGASAVAFGGVPAASFTVDSATQITAVSPSHGSGPAAVTVTTGLGTSPPNPLSRFAYGEGMFANTGPVPFTFGAVVISNGAPTATLLKTGKVLVAGGGTASAALYDPKAGTFTATGSLSSAKSFNTATLLPNGKVLIVGDKGEVYDPASGTFSVTTGAPVFLANRGPVATLLKTGKVLITSGTQAQLYDPATDAFTATGAPIDDHAGGKATLLSDGKVLLAGGPSGFTSSTSAELYDPSAGTFTRTGSMNVGRVSFTLTPLPGGKVLAAGGGFGTVSGDTNSAELYDPGTGNWTVTGSLEDYRRFHVATLLPSGKVLITGGTGSGVPVAGAELFDPAARGGQGGFVSAGRTEHPIAVPAAVLLSSDVNGFAADSAVCGDNCGKVLVVGSGRTVTPVTFTNGSAAELYTPHVDTPTGGGGGGTGSGLTSNGMTSNGTTSSAGDTTAPGVSDYGLTNNPFTVGGSTPTFGSASAKKKKRHKKGTTFHYTLSEAATVRIAIAQRRSGRRKGKRCVAPTRKLRKARKCTRITTRGTLTRTSHQGANRVAFSGRIGSKKLSPGSYQATLVATDSSKNTSRARTISFTIVKR